MLQEQPLVQDQVLCHELHEQSSDLQQLTKVREQDSGYLKLAITSAFV